MIRPYWNRNGTDEHATMHDSNHTGRTHRTMADAFGPYTSSSIEEPRTPETWIDRWCLVLAVVLLIAMFVAAAVLP